MGMEAFYDAKPNDISLNIKMADLQIDKILTKNLLNQPTKKEQLNALVDDVMGQLKHILSNEAVNNNPIFKEKFKNVMGFLSDAKHGKLKPNGISNETPLNEEIETSWKGLMAQADELQKLAKSSKIIPTRETDTPTPPKLPTDFKGNGATDRKYDETDKLRTDLKGYGATDLKYDKTDRIDYRKEK